MQFSCTYTYEHVVNIVNEYSKEGIYFDFEKTFANAEKIMNQKNNRKNKQQQQSQQQQMFQRRNVQNKYHNNDSSSSFSNFDSSSSFSRSLMNDNNDDTNMNMNFSDNSESHRPFRENIINNNTRTRTGTTRRRNRVGEANVEYEEEIQQQQQDHLQDEDEDDDDDDDDDETDDQFLSDQDRQDKTFRRLFKRVGINGLCFACQFCSSQQQHNINLSFFDLENHIRSREHFLRKDQQQNCSQQGCPVIIHGRPMLFDHHCIFPSTMFGTGANLFDDTVGAMLTSDITGAVQLTPGHEYTIVKFQLAKDYNKELPPPVVMHTDSVQTRYFCQKFVRQRNNEGGLPTDAKLNVGLHARTARSEFELSSSVDFPNSINIAAVKDMVQRKGDQRALKRLGRNRVIVAPQVQGLEALDSAAAVENEKDRVRHEFIVEKIKGKMKNNSIDDEEENQNQNQKNVVTEKKKKLQHNKNKQRRNDDEDSSFSDNDGVGDAHDNENNIANSGIISSCNNVVVAGVLPLVSTSTQSHQVSNVKKLARDRVVKKLAKIAGSSSSASASTTKAEKKKKKDKTEKKESKKKNSVEEKTRLEFDDDDVEQQRKKRKYEKKDKKSKTKK